MHRTLVLAALTLILLSSAGGLLHGWSVEHRTLLELREQYGEAFAAAGAGEPDRAQSALRAGQRANYKYVRVIDAHTHFIKLATLMLMVSFVMPLTGWDSGRQRGFAGTLICGAVLFPGSVLMQVYLDGWLFQGLAAAGAVLIIAAMGALALRFFSKEGLPVDYQSE